MKRIILAAVATSALLAAPAAFAQASSTVTVNGTVDALCGNYPQSGGGVGGSQTYSLGEMTDANGQLSVAATEISFGNTWCNGPATLTMTATKLSLNGDHVGPAPADSSSFFNKADMVVTGTIIDTYMGGGSATSNTPLVSNIPQAFETGVGTYSRATLNVVVPTGSTSGDRPVAGAYSGTIVLTASPQ